MASTCMQTVEPGPNGSQDRSPEETALHKAEKKKRKYERKQKRKAKKAAKLIEQTPTPAQEDAPAPSTPSPVRSVPINNEGLKSARAHYSPVPANVSPQLVKKPEILPKSADDEPDSDKEILEQSFATARSSDPLAKESIQSVRAVAVQASTLSPSVMSTSEYDNSVVMVDRPERGTDDDMVMQKVSTAILDSDEDGSIEETIITQGAQATLSLGSRPLVPKRHLQAIDLSADPDESDDEELSSLGESDPRGRDPEQIKPKRHAGFPAPEDLPGWFPTNIKQIYRVDRHGGALSFKELNEITRYRAALERIRRQKWNAYIEAGEARWKLQKIRRRLRTRPLTKAFSQYRNKQYQVWKEKALKAWKRLEKTHLGVSILDETININFRQERIIYEKKLGSRL